MSFEPEAPLRGLEPPLRGLYHLVFMAIPDSWTHCS